MRTVLILSLAFLAACSTRDLGRLSMSLSNPTCVGISPLDGGTMRCEIEPIRDAWGLTHSHSTN